MNDNEEYGTKLSIDISEYLKGLQDIKKATEEVATSIEKSKEKIKEFPDPQKSVKERLASGQIKVTGTNDENAKAVGLIPEKQGVTEKPGNWQQFQKYMLSIQGQAQNVNKVVEAQTEKVSALSNTWKFLKEVVNDLKNVVSIQEEEVNEEEEMNSKLLQLGTSSNKTLAVVKMSLSKITGELTKLGRKLTSTFSNGIKSLKRFALSLLGIQGGFMAVRKAMHSYMAMDSDLQKSLQQAWAGFGSFLAPIIEYLISLFQKLLAYTNAVVTALTGINFIARANAKALDKQAKSAGNASKALASFDEIKNLAQESGGGSANTIELPEVDASKITDFFERLKQLFEEGNYYEIGRIIADKIAEGLAGIDWEKIKSKLRLIAVNTATLLNGFFENVEMWFQIGRTIGEGLNSAITFLLNFVQTLNWRAIGSEIANSIMTAVRTINWTETWQLIADSFKGIADFLIGFFEMMQFDEILTTIVNGLFSADWSGATESILGLAGTLIGTLTVALCDGIYDAVVSMSKKFEDSVVEAVDEYFENGGTSIAEGILVGIEAPFKNIGYWIADHIFTPFINKFKEQFEIHSPSKVMERLGNQITEGLFNGISGIWNRVSGTFNNLRTNIVTVFSNIKIGVSNTMESLKSTMNTVWNEIWSIVKTVVNKIIGGVESMCNTCIRGLNKLIKPLANVGNEVLKVIGFNKMSFSTIGEISLPRLSIGTDLVKEEGLAYLHAGEKVVPADVVKGGYSGEGNKETNELLKQLISIVDEKDFNVGIDEDSIGRASVNYIKNQSRITGGSVI